MLLNKAEFLMMNNPFRAQIQRRFEAPRLLRMGGPTPQAHVLEVGCGRGVGVEILLDLFGAGQVDGVDLDPRMVARAEKRLSSRKDQVHLEVGDITSIPAPDNHYDAVFDFGIIHHVPDWQAAVREIYRVLKPGGRFYAEDVFERFILHPFWRRLLDHPMENRFDHNIFLHQLETEGFSVVAAEEMQGWFGWYVAQKPQK